MPIYKSKTPTKDGRIWFYKTNYTDVFGEHKQTVSKKYLTKTEAKKAEAEFLSKIGDLPAVNLNLTFRELYDKFYEHQADSLKFNTYNRYQYKLKYLECFMDMKCKDYTIEVYEDWKKYMMTQEQLCTRTKNDILKFWKSLLNYGMSWHDLDFMSVYRKMTNFTNPNEMPKEMEFYTFEEFQQFISQEDDLRFKILWETFYYCGLRHGEARGLTWDNIDFKKRKLSVKKQVQTDKTKGDNVWFITTPKTRDSIRTLPICDVLYDDLLTYYNEVSKVKNFNDGFYVFGNNKGIEPFNPKATCHRCHSLSKKADLKQIRIHDFRHSCASLLINSGASVTMVAKYLGHTKIDVTLNTYSHMFQNALDGVIDIINGLNEDSGMV